MQETLQVNSLRSVVQLRQSHPVNARRSAQILQRSVRNRCTAVHEHSLMKCILSGPPALFILIAPLPKDSSSRQWSLTKNVSSVSCLQKTRSTSRSNDVGIGMLTRFTQLSLSQSRSFRTKSDESTNGVISISYLT